MQNLTSQAPQGQAETPECSFLPFGTAVEYIDNLVSELRAAKVNGKATLTFTSQEIGSLLQARHSLRAARKSLQAAGELVDALHSIALSAINRSLSDLDPSHAACIKTAVAALARAEGK